MKIQQLGNKLRSAWSKDTCYPKSREEWNEDLPEKGQCAVTALVVNDYFGGEIVFNKRRNHYWNILPDRTELDFTKLQFYTNDDFRIDKIVDRNKFGKDVIQRYSLLKSRIND